MNNTTDTIKNTPDHCHNCHKLDDCHQAQNLHADTEPVEGFADDGDVYCKDCLDDANVAPHEFYEVFELYKGESDSPTHCGGCGIPIIHDLTIDGVEYVREALKDGGGCCAELWPVVWASYLDS